MNKSTTSLLLVTMMAFSGLASAQTADVKSGTQGGAGPTGASGYGDNGASVTTRGAVKAEIVPQKSGIQGGEGASPSTNPNTMKARTATAPKMTSAERKAQRAEARAARKSRLAGTAGNPPMKSGGSSN